jgi:hypothetical protein
MAHMVGASTKTVQSTLYAIRLKTLLGLHLVMLLSLQLHGQIQISEIVSSSSQSLLDENGDTPDWIELANVGLSPVNLNGFSLSDDINQTQKWVMSHYEMQPGEHLVLFASGKDRQLNLPSEPPPFEASDWPSLTTWLRAQDAQTEPGDESRQVKAWRNNLPDTWILKAASESSRPFLSPGTLNGHAVVHFDQAEQALRVADIPSHQFASNDAMTLLIVQRYTAPRHNGASIRFTTNQGDGFNLLALWSNGAMYFDFGNIGLRGRLATAPPKAFIDAWNLIALTRHPDGNSTIHVNGSLVATGELKAPFATKGSGELVIGDFDFQGDIAEIIGFKNALPSNQRIQIEAYLARKYGLAYKGAFFHTHFKINSEGESVYLYSPQGTLIDQSPNVPIPTDVSLGREHNHTEAWLYFPTPTPEQLNTNTGFKPPPSPPEFSHLPGFYHESIPLDIIHENPLVTIRYTTDGAEPDETSPAWKGNLTIPEGEQIPSRWALIPTNPSKHTEIENQFTMPEDKRDLFGWLPPRDRLFKAVTVRARAFSTNALPSTTRTRTYFITSEGADRYTLPVVTLSVDPFEWFDEEEGLYVPGKRYEPESWQHRFWGTGNYFLNGRFSERKAYLEFFESGERTFSGNIGLKIHGGGSRAQPQKSLRLIARNAIGPGTFTFFPGKKDREFSQLTLRNAGQDSVLHATMLRDVLIQALAPEGSITQSTHPVIVFLNGEYWGIHHLQEHFNDDDLKERFALDDIQMDLLEVNSVPKKGTSNAYETLMEKTRKSIEEDPNSMNEVLNLIDQDNFIDHYITQIYFDNVDWPGNNVAFFKAEAKIANIAPQGVEDGKWRWLTYGVEAATGMNDDITHNSIRRIIDVNFADGSAAPWSTELFRALITNETFKHALINRFAGLLNTSFSTGHVMSKLAEKQNELAPEIEEHIGRWRRPWSIDAWNENLDVIRIFAKERPRIQRQHWMEAFNLSGTYESQLTITPSSGGEVRIHRTRIGSFSQRMEPGQTTWTGTYFNNIPITYEAIPSKGFRFIGWNGDVRSETNPITIQPNSNIQISAHFASDLTVPNPMITIKNESPVLSFQIGIEETDIDYEWEISSDLKQWRPLETTVTSKDPVDEKSMIISSTFSNREIMDQPLFFRISRRFP